MFRSQGGLCYALYCLVDLVLVSTGRCYALYCLVDLVLVSMCVCVVCLGVCVCVCVCEPVFYLLIFVNVCLLYV